MSKRGRFGALAGALLLTFAVASVASAAQPTYSISVTKSASTTSVPAAGADVTFTVWVTNTGTGDFNGLSVTDSNASCTYDGPVASGSNKFASGDAWKYTCTYKVVPPATNTVTAAACHDNGNCSSGNADVTATASVTITAAVTVTAKPTVKATVLNTATVDNRTSSTDGTWLAIVALGILLASVVVLTPRRSKSRS
jgi:uncharacterized repeat protein (TIGR01451 family)